MSAYTKPIVVDVDGAAVALERLPMGSGNQGLFSEKWLQGALFANPQCLPMQEIDPHIGPLISANLKVSRTGTDRTPSGLQRHSHAH
jgi:hypothetical protein